MLIKIGKICFIALFVTLYLLIDGCVKEIEPEDDSLPEGLPEEEVQDYAGHCVNEIPDPA